MGEDRRVQSRGRSALARLEIRVSEMSAEVHALRERFDAHVDDEMEELQAQLKALHDKLSEVQREIMQFDATRNGVGHLGMRMEHLEKSVHEIRKEAILANKVQTSMAEDVSRIREELTKWFLRGATALQREDRG